MNFYMLRHNKYCRVPTNNYKNFLGRRKLKLKKSLDAVPLNVLDYPLQRRHPIEIPSHVQFPPPFKKVRIESLPPFPSRLSPLFTKLFLKQAAPKQAVSVCMGHRFLRFPPIQPLQLAVSLCIHLGFFRNLNKIYYIC